VAINVVFEDSFISGFDSEATSRLGIGGICQCRGDSANAEKPNGSTTGTLVAGDVARIIRRESIQNADARGGESGAEYQCAIL
jgi:hypothetical protein